MTTPIMKALDIAQQPPYILGWQELDIFIRDITAIYEQQTHNDREAYLIDDCVSLILRHRMAKVDGENMTNNSPVRLYPNRSEKDLKNIQGCIEEIARLLLRVTDSLNTRLPESFIEQCRNSTEESASRFYEIIAEAYITPAWKAQNKATSGTKGKGMGSNATTDTQTPPAEQEQPRKTRKTKEFIEFVKNQDEAGLIIAAIDEEIDEMTVTKDKAKVIVACTDIWINKPTSTSVKKEFNITESEFSQFKDCITFHYEPTNSRAPQKGYPFPKDELEKIQEEIREKIKKIQAEKG